LFGQLNSIELRIGLTLASVIAFRMLGLFMILPVFMLLAADMPGFSPAKAGLAVGIYGLTQAALQQPFGKLSDRFGRRPVMLAGLALFATGGVVAALAGSIELLIAGRALQGSTGIRCRPYARAESKCNHGHHWYGHRCVIPAFHDDRGTTVHTIGFAWSFMVDSGIGYHGDAVGIEFASSTGDKGRSPTGIREFCHCLAVRDFGILTACSYDLVVCGFTGNDGQPVWL
jgi:hypothetical protein